MNISNSNINKNLYKIFLTVVKYTPMFLAITQTAHVLTNYLGINTIVLVAFGGLSLPFLILLFIMSYVFKFCYLYRIPLIYLTLYWILSMSDYVIGIPLTTLNMFRLYAFIFGIFIIIFVIYMYKNRNKPKIDHIKQMCENYTKCCS